MPFRQSAVSFIGSTETRPILEFRSFEKLDVPAVALSACLTHLLSLKSKVLAWKGGSKVTMKCRNNDAMRDLRKNPNTAQDQTSEFHWKSIRPLWGSFHKFTFDLYPLSNLFNLNRLNLQAFPFKLEWLIRHFFPPARKQICESPSPEVPLFICGVVASTCACVCVWAPV